LHLLRTKDDLEIFVVNMTNGQSHYDREIRRERMPRIKKPLEAYIWLPFAGSQSLKIGNQRKAAKRAAVGHPGKRPHRGIPVILFET
jgi:small-conductance mechanosensitive channel